MRPPIFLLTGVLVLSMAALAVAGDCPGGVCPLEKNATALPSIIVNIPHVVEVAAVGIIAQRQPVRSIIRGIESTRPVRNIAKGLVARKPGRSIAKRVLKFPRRLLRRRS